MSFRYCALLCLSGLAACSHNTSEPVKDPTYVEEPTPSASEPALQPASLEGTSATTTDSTSTQTSNASSPGSAPLVADTKGTGSADYKPKNQGTEPVKPAPAPDAAQPGAPPDNTKVNKRDTNSAALTPTDQQENQTDLAITQKIRQAVMADDSLSFTAKNVKIITQNGKVTLRGPVNTAQERSAIEAAARKVAGATQVDNQLEVKK